MAKELLYPLLPKFTEAMVAALQVPDGFTSDSGLKMEILKVSTTYVVCTELLGELLALSYTSKCNVALCIMSILP